MISSTMKSCLKSFGCRALIINASDIRKSPTEKMTLQLNSRTKQFKAEDRILAKEETSFSSIAIKAPNSNILTQICQTIRQN